MKFRMLLFVLTVCVMPVGAAFASCSNYTSIQSGYKDVGKTWGDTSYCSSYTTRYYHNSDTKEYGKVISCSACSNSGVKTTTSGGFADCSFSYSYCTLCTTTTTKPSGTVLSTVPVPQGCATTSVKYMTSSQTSGYFTVNGCSTCPSGSWLEQQYGKMGACPYSRGVCTRCEPGTYRINNSCVSCSAGTYSDTYNASSCTTCPSATDFYTNSALSTYPSVSNGSITSPVKATKNDCYALGKTYYDSKGTWTYGGTCTYDGTATVDNCATVTKTCLSSSMGWTSLDVKTTKPSGAAGKYCFCTANGKSFYMTTMGSSDTDATACNSACLGACTSTITNNATLRANLGC